jgi:perosamine synthetase
MNSRILYTKPSITNLEVQYATDAIANGWGENCYNYITKFESLFRDHLGVNFTIATSSCTGALHMGLAGLNIGPGDEVILADTNWIATAAPIVYLGATPIFVDILPDSWCIDPSEVEKAITPKTKAIIAVHLYGNLADMDLLLAIGSKYNIPVIEDAAEAIGSVYHGKRAGTMGKFGAFSFHGSKTVTTGEGGMFVTNDLNLFEKVLILSNHGRTSTQTKQFWPDILGFKYKMSNIQAAIGCAQVERIEELIQRKQEILNFYRKNLSHLAGASLNHELKNCVNGAWMPTIEFKPDIGITRNQLLEGFKSNNIDARSFFYPLSSLPLFSDRNENINAWSIPNYAINLPSFHDMNMMQQNRVVEVLNEIYENNLNAK